MSGKDGVVRLDDRGGGLRSRVYTEFELALLAVVDGESLHQKGTETRSGTTTEGVEDQETLEAGTAVRNTTNLVQYLVDKLLANRIMATRVVVGSILLSSNHLLRMEKASVDTSADLVDYVGLEIAVDSARHVLALACNPDN